MTPITILLLTILLTSATGFSDERNHARRFIFGNDKADANPKNSDDPSSDQSISKWFSGFLSGNSNKDKQSDSFSKLALLKKLLSSSSSSSNNNNSPLDKLFDILHQSASDDKNEGSSSSTKIDRIMGFFNKQGSSSSSSSNLQLAMKLLDLAQGKGSLSSFSFTDLNSLMKFAGK